MFLMNSNIFLCVSNMFGLLFRIISGYVYGAPIFSCFDLNSPLSFFGVCTIVKDVV